MHVSRAAVVAVALLVGHFASAAPATDIVSKRLAAQAANGDRSIPALMTFRTGPSHDPRPALRRVAAVADALASDYAALGLEVRHRYVHLPVLAVNVNSELLQTLATDSRVAGITSSRTLRAFRTQGKKLMHVPEVQALGWDGEGVGIAILDTGVDYDHDELSPGGTSAGVKTIKLYDAIDLDDDPRDKEGHGTSVAGIAAGDDGGVAEAATIVAVRVLDEDGEGSSEQILDGIDAVLASLDSGNPHNIRVANLSLGGYDENEWPPFNGTCDDIAADFKAAFDALTDAGVLVVVASGNGGCSGGVAFPACISSAMAVGAVYDDEICTLPAPPPFDCFSRSMSFSPDQCRSNCSDDTKADRIACYSDSGDQLDVWAPSHCARTPKKGGGLEDCFGGTSAAAPYVAGVAALLAQAKPGITATGLRTALHDSGKAINDGRNGVTRNRVDAAAALGLLNTCDAPATPSSLGLDSASTCGDVSVNVSWQPVAGAASYQVQTATDASFTTDVQSHTTTASSIDLSFAGDQSFQVHIRVRAVAPCGAVSSPSATAQLAYTGRCVSEPAVTTYVLGVAHAAGVPPAFFYTDLAMLNTGSSDASVTLTFRGAATLTATARVPAGQQVSWQDVLVSLFAATGQDVGVVRVDSDAPVDVLARTYSRPTDANDRSFGQQIAGLGLGQALLAGEVGHFLALRSDNPWSGTAPFRTNLLFANVGEIPADVEVRFFTDAGALIATTTLAAIAPDHQKQQTYALPVGYAAAWAEVRVSPDGAAVIGIASVVDGTSTDPTTIPLVAP